MAVKQRGHAGRSDWEPAVLGFIAYLNFVYSLGRAS